MKQNKAAEKEFFDRYPRRYEVLKNEGYGRILKELIRKVNPQKGWRLLDLGCGSGSLLQRFKQGEMRLAGIDISIKNIRQARTFLSGDRCIVGDIERVPFMDNTFDVIIYGGVLHHFPQMADILQEGHRILKPGGHLFSYDPHRYNPFMWIYRDRKSPFRSGEGVTTNEILITKGMLREALGYAGFTSISVTAISGVAYKFVAGTLARKLLPWYNLIDKIIDRSFLRERYGAFIIASAQK